MNETYRTQELTQMLWIALGCLVVMTIAGLSAGLMEDTTGTVASPVILFAIITFIFFIPENGQAQDRQAAKVASFGAVLAGSSMGYLIILFLSPWFSMQGFEPLIGYWSDLFITVVLFFLGVWRSDGRCFDFGKDSLGYVILSALTYLVTTIVWVTLKGDGL